MRKRPGSQTSLPGKVVHSSQGSSCPRKSPDRGCHSTGLVASSWLRAAWSPELEQTPASSQKWEVGLHVCVIVGLCVYGLGTALPRELGRLSTPPTALPFLQELGQFCHLR